MFEALRIIKAPAGFKLMTYSFVVYALTHLRDAVLQQIRERENFYKNKLDFISIGSTSRYESTTYHHKCMLFQANLPYFPSGFTHELFGGLFPDGGNRYHPSDVLRLKLSVNFLPLDHFH